MQNRRYLITCGTSRVGLEIAKNLAKYAKRGNVESILLGTRNLSNGFKWVTELQEEHSSILFGTACLDISCQKSCQRAFLGVTDLILVVPPSPNDLYRYCQMMCEFAHLNAVQRLTLVGPAFPDNTEYEKQFSEVCNFIQALRFPYSVVRFHPILLDNIWYQTPAFLEGKFKTPVKPEARFSYTCCSDIGLAVTYVCTSKDPRGREAYCITGPDTTCLNDLIANLSKIIPVQHDAITFEMERELMLEKGNLFGEKEFIDGLVDIHRNINNGNPAFSKVSEDFKTLTGKKPTSYMDFITKMKPTLTLMNKQMKGNLAAQQKGASSSGGISQAISEGIGSARRSLEVS